MTDKDNTPQNHRQPPDDQPQPHILQERDRFELLSAYLDGEVTTKERQQVQHLLDTDPKFQLLHRRMLQLRCGMHQIPTPVPSQSAQQLSQAVFQKIDHRQRRRKLWAWGSGAMAALFLGGVPVILPKLGIDSPLFQVAQNKGDSEPLQIALNRPTVKIPPPPDLFPHMSPRLVR